MFKITRTWYWSEISWVQSNAYYLSFIRLTFSDLSYVAVSKKFDLHRLFSLDRFLCFTVKNRDKSQNSILIWNFLCINLRLWCVFHWFWFFRFELPNYLVECHLYRLFSFDRFLSLFNIVLGVISFISFSTDNGNHEHLSIYSG